MLPTSLRHTLSVLVAAAILAGPASLTATPSAAEEMSANAKAQKAAKARRKAMERLKKARAAKAKRAKAKAARAKAARAKARAAKEKAAKAKAAKAAKAKAAKEKAAKEKAAKERAAMERAAKAKSKSPEMAKPKTMKPEKAKPKTAKPKSGDKQTQTALSAQPMTKLAKLARSIEQHMTAGEADGSLTKGELARLASLKQRVEIMDRMSRNDENFSDWERHYLETANTILKDIVQRHRLDREMSVEPRHIEMRIQRGVQDGTLTEQQAENLREIQRRILVARNEADQDGSLSPREKARYWRTQYRLSDLLNHTRRYGPVARTLGQSGFKKALQRGVRNGSFSRTEARELWRTHQRIRGLREKAIADGKITAIELTVLNKRLKAERHRLSYGERAAYRRSLRKRRRIARGRSHAGGGNAAANRGAAAVRNYGRSVGRGMRNLGRTFGR